MITSGSEDIYTLEQKTQILKIDFKVFLESYLDHYWSLSIKRLARHRLGQCNYFKRAVEINKDYLEINAISEFQDTLRHEIAHAIVFERYRYDEKWASIKPHGKEWKDIALTVGALPKCCQTNIPLKPKLNYWLECSFHGVVDSWINKPAWYMSNKTDEIKRIICYSCKIKGTNNYLDYKTIK